MIHLPVTGGWASIGRHQDLPILLQVTYMEAEAQIDKWITDLAYQISSQSDGSGARSLSPRCRSSSIPRGNSSSLAPGSGGFEEDDTNGNPPRSEIPSPRLPTLSPGSHNTTHPPRSHEHRAGNLAGQPQRNVNDPRADTLGSPALGPVRSSPIRDMRNETPPDALRNRVRTTQRGNDLGRYRQNIEPRSGSPSVFDRGLRSNESPRQPFRWSQGSREADTSDLALRNTPQLHNAPSLPVYNTPTKHNPSSMHHPPSMQTPQSPVFQQKQNPPIHIHSPASHSQDDQDDEEDEDGENDASKPTSKTPVDESMSGLSISRGSSVSNPHDLKARAQREQGIRRLRYGLEPRIPIDSREAAQRGGMESRNTFHNDAPPSMHHPSPRTPNAGGSFLDLTKNQNPRNLRYEQSSFIPPRRSPLLLDRLRSAHDNPPTSMTSSQNFGAEGDTARRLVGAQDGPALSLRPYGETDSAWGRRNSGDGSDIFTSAPTRRLGGPINSPVPNPNLSRLGYDLPSFSSLNPESGSQRVVPPPSSSPRGRGSGLSPRGRGSGPPRDDPPVLPSGDEDNSGPTHNSRSFGGDGTLDRSGLGDAYLYRLMQPQGYESYDGHKRQDLPEYLNDIWSVPDEYEEEEYFDNDSEDESDSSTDFHDEDYDSATDFHEDEEPYWSDSLTVEMNGYSSDGEPLMPQMTTEEFIKDIVERVVTGREREVDQEVESDEIDNSENIEAGNQKGNEEPADIEEALTEAGKLANYHTSLWNFDQMIQPGTLGGYMPAPELHDTVHANGEDGKLMISKAF